MLSSNANNFWQTNGNQSKGLSPANYRLAQEIDTRDFNSQGTAGSFGLGQINKKKQIQPPPVNAKQNSTVVSRDSMLPPKSGSSHLEILDQSESASSRDSGVPANSQSTRPED